jgi:hypothetical protein
MDESYIDYEWMIQALSPNQRHVLDLIAINEDRGHHPRTLESLERRHLIVARDELLGGRFPVRIKRYDVPTPVHMAWCALCAKEVEAAGGIEAIEAKYAS